jgi:PAS domain S-box-containing protein
VSNEYDLSKGGKEIDCPLTTNSCEKLLEVEKNYGQLFNLNPLPMWVIDAADFRFLQVNLAAIQHYGYTREEFLQMTALDIRPEADVEKFEALRRTMDNRSHEVGTWQHIKRDGTTITVEVAVAGILYEGKKARLVVVNDITEKLATQRSLKSAEANMRTLLENTDTAHILIDTHFTILAYNELARKMAPKKGIDYNNLPNYLDLMPPERRDIIRSKVASVLQTGNPVNYEVNYQVEDGSPVWLYVRLHAIYNDETGSIAGVSIAATDITQRKATELLLEKQNERLRLVSKATNDAIWDWNLQNDTIYWGESYTRLFGYPVQSDKFTGGESWLSRVHAEDAERVHDKIFRQIFQSKDNYWQDEYRYLRADGTVAYVYDRGYIIYDATGEPVRMVGAMQDITDKKAYELERDRITTDLIQRNKDLEQFAYIVSHNLRQHVANISTLNNLLKDHKLPCADRDAFAAMQSDSVHKLDSVIMDLNHILQTRRSINEKKEQVMLQPLIDDIAEHLILPTQKKQVYMHTHFEVGQLFVIRSYIYSIFYNLISNSLKYRKPNQDVHIEILATQQGSNIVFTYTDNGMGLDMERNSDKVFGLYKRFHKHVEGKGLGLFMTKTQVEAMGGNISVESKLNEGTTFYISLPQ